jgi:hypothetical protein
MFKRTKGYAMGGSVKGTKYMSKGGAAKGTKYMSKGGALGYGGKKLDPKSRKQSFIDSKDSGLRNVGRQAERELGLRISRGPGMKKGGAAKGTKYMSKGGKS